MAAALSHEFTSVCTYMRSPGRDTQTDRRDNSCQSGMAIAFIELPDEFPQFSDSVLMPIPIAPLPPVSQLQ